MIVWAAMESSMKWLKPKVQEYCVGMEVTSYESAEIDPETLN
jgi:coenzyme PQQ precursor peptide PqqA